MRVRNLRLPFFNMQRVKSQVVSMLSYQHNLCFLPYCCLDNVIATSRAVVCVCAFIIPPGNRRIKDTFQIFFSFNIISLKCRIEYLYRHKQAQLNCRA